MSFSFLLFLCKRRAEIIFKKIIYSILILFTFVFHLIIGFWLVYLWKYLLTILFSVMIGRFQTFFMWMLKNFCISLSINQNRNNNLIIDIFEMISRWGERRKILLRAHQKAIAEMLTLYISYMWGHLKN